jgi:hypothetical protein
MRQVRKQSFFEKKDQKTFLMTLVHGAFRAIGAGPFPSEHRTMPTTNPLEEKVFCFFFSKKKRFLPNGCAA